MRLSIMMIMLLGLASCGGSGGGGGDKALNPVQEAQTGETGEVTTSEEATFNYSMKRKTELNQDQSNLQEYKDDINTHVVTFNTLSGNYRDASVYCFKTHFDGTKESFSERFDHRGLKAKVEIKLSDSDPAEVDFDCSIKLDDRELDRTPLLKVQKSFVVTGKANYSTSIGANSVGTILLEKGSELSTDGAFIDLKAKEIISLGGKLVTFHADRVNSTYDNRDGASGGVINIEAGTASGELVVELRGLNGGKQTRLQPKMDKIPPRDPSLNGQCSSYRHPTDTRCYGKQGLKGFQGLQGLPGHPGGDAGLLMFKTIKKSVINLEVKHYPGMGGEGGEGGEGGIGGPGGIGSLVTWHERKDPGPRCPQCSPLETKSIQTRERHKFPDGPQGVKGDVGIKGEMGVTGKILESKLIFSEEDMVFSFISDWKNF